MAIDPGRVKALFQEAIERDDPGERRAFLDREVGDDAELRGRLDVLLAAHDRPPGVLDRPLDADLQATDNLPGATGDFTEATPGRADAGGPGRGRRDDKGPTLLDAVIAGRYKLRQEIGEGGMGSVYLAEQLRPVKRMVALKLIKPGMDTRNVLARFESERQALALMDHPHIAKVLDAGSTEQGRPFFVMELVKGIPITAYCDRHNLGIPERLAIFRQVCSAVQHAHQKGIIHRDLKPTNILVEAHDDRPVPKVIDFGLAKATSGMKLTDQSLFTAFGSVTGTPLYMAPEQASFNALDVDTRADIYALGVILYELLTGSTPIHRDTLRRAALDEMLRVIREVEPPTPSSRISTSDALPSLAAKRHIEPTRLSRFVKGDLDWIVMKALAKERGRRYDSAVGLANDLERFANHEPVSAGPPTATYRLRKFARRNWGRVVAATLVLLALVGGVVGTTLGLVEARRQGRRAEARREAAEKSLAQRDKANEILMSIFQDLKSSGPGEEGPPLAEQLGKRLDAATANLEGEANGDAMAVARMQMALGSAQGVMGDPEKGVVLFTMAHDTLAARLGADHPDTLRCARDLARALERAGQVDRCITLLEGTLPLYRESFGADHTDTLRMMLFLATSYSTTAHLEAFATHNHSTPQSQARARRLVALAGNYSKAEQLGRAVGAYEATLAAFRAKYGPDHPDTLRVMGYLGGHCILAGQKDRGITLYEEALDLSRAKDGPHGLGTIGLAVHLAEFLQGQGRLDRAESLWKEVLAAYQKAFSGRTPGRMDADRWAAHASNAESHLARLYRDRGDWAAAVPFYRNDVARARRVPERRAELGRRLAILVRALLDLKQWPEAEAACREALAIREAEAPDDWATFNARSMLGAALLGQGKAAQAAPLLRSGYEGMAKRADRIPADGKARLSEALDRLIASGEASGNADEVEAWKAERAKLSAEAPVEPGKK